MSLVDLVKNANSLGIAVRNHGGGHYNHSLFWTFMTPVGTSNAGPTGNVFLILLP